METNDPKKELAELFVGLCLGKLVSLGRVTREQVNGNWYVEFNDAKLQAKGFGGAATLDLLNHPAVYLSSQLNIKCLMYVTAHEAVHLMQICKGDLLPCYRFSAWKGEEYRGLPHDDPGYFKAQPWEREADELQPQLVKHLESKVDSFTSAAAGSES